MSLPCRIDWAARAFFLRLSERKTHESKTRRCRLVSCQDRSCSDAWELVMHRACRAHQAGQRFRIHAKSLRTRRSIALPRSSSGQWTSAIRVDLGDQWAYPRRLHRGEAVRRATPSTTRMAPRPFRSPSGTTTIVPMSPEAGQDRSTTVSGSTLSMSFSVAVMDSKRPDAKGISVAMWRRTCVGSWQPATTRSMQSMPPQ